MDNQQERLLEDLNWLAGAWESEGWFSMIKEFKRKVTGRNYKLNCGIVNSDMNFISQIKIILTKLQIPHYISKPRIFGIGKKPKVQIVIQGFKRVNYFLNIISPYIRVKNEKVNLIKKFIEYRKNLPSQKYPYGEYEKSLYEKIKFLNNRKTNNIPREHTPNSTNKVDEDVLRTESKDSEVSRNVNPASECLLVT